MTLDTFGSLILLGIGLLAYIVMKVGEKYVSLDYYNQKVVIHDGGSNHKSKERRVPCTEDARIAVHI